MRVLRARRSLTVQTVTIALVSGAAQVAMALLYALGARNSTPAEFGDVATAIATSLAVIGLLDFGSNSLWVRELARRPAVRAQIAAQFWTKVALALALALIGTVALLAIGAPGFLVVAVWIGASSLVGQSTAVFLRADQRSDLATFSLVADRSVAVVVMIVSMALGVPSAHALGVAVLAGLLAGMIVTWIATPSHLRPRPSPRRFANPWRGSLHFGVAGLASALQGFDTTVVRATGGADVAGAYAAVNRWTQPMSLLSGAFSNAAAPFFASATSGRAAVAAARRSLWLPCAAAALAIVVALFAEPLVSLVLGSQYTASVAVLRALAVGAFFVVWNQPAAVLLQARDRDRAVALVRLVGSALFIAATAFAVPLAGALGAALCYLALQVFIFVAFGFTLLRLR